MAHDKTRKPAISLLKDRSGYAAVTFAIAAVPMVTIVGLTFDASLAYRYKTNLQTAADAATLSMARRSVLNPDIPESELVADAKLLFERHVRGQSVPLPVRYNQMTVDTNKVDAVLKAEVTYNLNFGGLIGMQDIKIPVESKAEFTRTEIDFYTLLDNTPSMALGASQNDIDRLETEVGCAFACHTVNAPEYLITLPGASMPQGYSNISDVPDNASFNPSFDTDNNGIWSDSERNNFLRSRGIPTQNHHDTYYLAKERGIKLRFDAVKQGVDTLTRRASELERYQGQYRIGLYHFGENAWDMAPTEVQAPTDRLNRVREKAEEIGIMDFGGGQFANTEIKTNLNFVANKMIDDRRSHGNRPREQVLFFVTDGVVNGRDTDGTCNGVWAGGQVGGTRNNYRCHEPIRPEVCQALKEQGIRIALLYTPYLPTPRNGWYRTHVGPWQDQIAVKARECATPGLFFEADVRTDSIDDAMATLLERSVDQLRLTPAS